MAHLETMSGLRKIGEYLPCPPPDIDWALSVQAMESALGNLMPIGEILVDRERVSPEILADALKSQLIDRLRLSSLLEELNQEHLTRIAQQTDQVALAPGETLFQEGYRGNSLYVVLRGRMLLSNSEAQSEYPAGVALPGDVLGESDFFSDGTRRYTAYAIERSSLLKIGYNLIPRSRSETEPASSRPSQNHIIQRTREALSADRIHLFLCDEHSHELTTGIDMGERVCVFKIMPGTDIAGWVAHKRTIVNLREAYLDSRFDPAMDIQTGYWTRTLLAVPILEKGGKVLGVLQAVNKLEGWFDSDDETVLLACSKQLAASL